MLADCSSRLPQAYGISASAPADEAEVSERADHQNSGVPGR